MKYKISLISRHLFDTMNLTGAGIFCKGRKAGCEEADHIPIYGRQNNICRKNFLIEVTKGQWKEAGA